MVELWPLVITFFIGGMLSEVARWYFNEYLKNHAKRVADTLHERVDPIVRQVKP